MSEQKLRSVDAAELEELLAALPPEEAEAFHRDRLLLGIGALVKTPEGPRRLDPQSLIVAKEVVKRRWCEAMGAWRRLASRCARELNRSGWLHVRPIDILKGWDAAGYLPSSGFTHQPVRVGPRAELAQDLVGTAAVLCFPRSWGNVDFASTAPPAHVKPPRATRRQLRRQRWAEAQWALQRATS